MQPDQPTQKNPVIIGIIAIVIVVVLIGGAMALKKKETASSTNNTASQTAANTDNKTPAVEGADTSTGTYKSGNYSATGSYSSPGGTEQIAVTLTLDGDTITDVTASPKAASPESSTYQEQFIEGYKSMVVGKDIDTVSLSKVSGSSLTSRGFNDAIDQIKQQAQA
ncbi:MAG TPA: FMN-binding protein [Candidatus Saccharimonadales bacterium]|nr:FMN-binding protein [Candidatus Saccharimonadales bacterium]